jgi:hypothetical protein
MGHGDDYLNGAVNYTEPLFVIVIMAIASRALSSSSPRTCWRVARQRLSPAAWWLSILIL